MSARDEFDRTMLDLAARVAWRGAGHVEPNPLVGCVLVRDGVIIGLAHHARFGQAHAEVLAIADARAREHEVRGCTAYVTLEPCNGQGRNGPCSRALIEAGVSRVIAARRDPNPSKAGGMEALIAAGIDARVSDVSVRATRLSDAFVKRVRTGLPWVIVKWAQSIDGKIALESGESQWISCEQSRRRVHRLRARVDAIVTAIGTVVRDRPRLTARGVAVRRVARRVVIDPAFEMRHAEVRASLMTDLARAGLTVFVARDSLAKHADDVATLRGAGVEVVGLDASDGELAPEAMLRHLAREHACANVLIEAGPSTVGRFVRAGMLDEIQAYVAPIVIGQRGAPAGVEGLEPPGLSDAARMESFDVRRVGVDVRLTWRRTQTEIG
jgi:diaminohydroxyphosphoribosylaminopyrimidine deaminase/5-amino-6-(5-phosphoribosylamino)uracil reductase